VGAFWRFSAMAMPEGALGLVGAKRGDPVRGMVSRGRTRAVARLP
jgi:hypothetical protein